MSGSFSAAWRDALDRLARRSQSVAELRRKLHDKGHAAAVVDEVLARLVEQRLVDDAALAYNAARRRAEEGRKGPRRVAAELLARGLPSDLVNEAVRTAFGPEDLREALGRALARLGGGLGPAAWSAEQRERLGRRLVSRGFPAALVRQTLAQSPADDHDLAVFEPSEDDDDAIP